jgi:hypothetical protein
MTQIVVLQSPLNFIAGFMTMLMRTFMTGGLGRNLLALSDHIKNNIW